VRSKWGAHSVHMHTSHLTLRPTLTLTLTLTLTPTPTPTPTPRSAARGLSPGAHAHQMEGGRWGTWT